MRSYGAQVDTMKIYAVASGKVTVGYGKSPILIGKSTISMGFQ